MEVSERSLYELYDDMDTDELHELYRNRKNTLTDTALGVLERVLSEKGVTTEQIEILDEQIEKNSKFKLRLASLDSRFLAQILDTIVIMILIFIPVVIFENSLSFIVIIGFVASSTYALMQDAFPNGQSIGKRVLNIAVVNKDTGKPCGIYQSINRNGILFFTGYIGLLFLLSKDRQTLGDMVANTIVVTNDQVGITSNVT